MAHKNVPRSALFQATIDALVNRPRTLTLSMISEATGLQERWLVLLASKNPSVPSVDACVRLYEYLTNRSISL